MRCGLSFRLNVGQMIAKIYLPAMRAPVVNGLRIGLGDAIIGTLLAETKLANQGLGYAVIQTYATFDMPRMYALLIVIPFALTGWRTSADRARKRLSFGERRQTRRPPRRALRARTNPSTGSRWRRRSASPGPRSARRPPWQVPRRSRSRTG